MNEDKQVIWGQPISFQDFVQGFQVAPNQRRVKLVPKADPQKFYTREKVTPPSQDQGEIRDANKERVNRSLSNYASNNFLLSTSNIRPDQNGRYNPGLGQFAGDQTALTLSMGFDPFNASNYYKVATQIPKFRNWGLTRLLADELNNEVRIAGELGKNVGNVPTSTNNLFRATVYKGGEITDPHSTFFTTDPKYASNYGKVTPYTFESKNVVKTTEPMMGYRDPVNMDMFVYNNIKSNPEATAIIGKDKVTGEFIPSQGIEILSLTPRNFTLKSVQEPKTSLRFFEKPQSRISEAERLGISKGERNFKPKWHVANYPGYQLKGLMGGSPLERQLSKNGTININQLNAYFNKASQLEREVANKVLAEKFAGQKTIDYNQFKKAVQDELINYSTKPQMQYSTYGMDRLGFNVIKEPDGAGGIIEYLPGVRTNTFTFESPRILQGSNKHYDYGTLGHSRTYTTSDEPRVLHVMESQSDWAQEGIAKTNEAYRQKLINNPESYNKRINSLYRMNKELEDWENMMRTGINHSGIKLQPYEIQQIQQEFIPNLRKDIQNLKSKLEGNPQALHLSDNYLQRQLQENLRYATENGQTKMRYPTSETAAKIEGYKKETVPRPTRNREIELRDQLDKMWKEYYDANKSQLNNASLLELEQIGRKNIPNYAKIMDELEYLRNIPDKYEYIPAHQTILKKYADFPKLFQKLFKDQKVRTVTDTKGNTWYEVDVPKGYLNREWQYKLGGILISNNPIQRFKNRNK